MGDQLGALYSRVMTWLKAPYTQPMDAVQIFLLTGLVVVSILLWHRILAVLPKGD